MKTGIGNTFDYYQTALAFISHSRTNCQGCLFNIVWIFPRLLYGGEKTGSPHRPLFANGYLPKWKTEPQGEQLLR